MYVFISEFNLLLGVMYLEIGVVALAVLLTFIGFYVDIFYPIGFAVLLLTIAAGDSVLAISFLIYLNRVGTNASLSYLHVLRK
jgi:NADH:ubiquinone oxidoreductase subunit K